MLASQIPSKFVAAFAHAAGGGFIRNIPATTGTPGAAALDTGFPPVNFQPLSGGGIPPAGADFNGILKQTTAWAQWIAAAGICPYDAAFQTAIGGYPHGAVLMAASGTHFWISTADNNATNPDAAGAGWINPTAVANLAAHSVLANLTGVPAAPSAAPFDFTNLATGEYQIGPLYVKRGRAGPFVVDSGHAIPFLNPFPNSCDQVLVTPELSGAYGISSDSWVVLDEAALTVNGFSIHIASSANAQQLFVNWRAEGT